jgi:DNA-binding beta-propeller fold protein YncE
LNKRRLSLIPLLFLVSLLAAQDDGGAVLGSDIEALHAAESFRVGIEAYYRASFNEAILAFEQALSFKPDEGLIIDWLGRSYYRSGMESIAIRQWQNAARIYGESSPEALLIYNRVEMVSARRGLFPLDGESARYVEIGHFPGSAEGITSFNQPSSVLPQDDGSLWVAAYGSNELVRLDVNGIVRQRQRGPLSGFDRPYYLAQGLDGKIYVSEFRGGRIGVLDAQGNWLGSISSKGIESGQLSGPAAMTVDWEGYLYVVEFGNRRVSKFDPDGEFINCFGMENADFRGFQAPTGIAAHEGLIYVADSVAKCIYTFDSNGLYLGILLSQGLEGPESLRIMDDGSLLVTDTKRILALDPVTTIIRELCPRGNTRIRYLDSNVDMNGNLMAANFDNDELTVLCSLDSIAAGLFVQIDRVIADQFPEVTVELRVEDSRRRPIVGLDQTNFMLNERGSPVQNQTFIGAGNASRESDISVLLERSPETSALRDTLAAALRDINAAMRGAGNIVSVISAGPQPVRERFDGENPSSVALAARGNAASYSPLWRFDLGLRLAATDLLRLSPKRSVVFVTSGRGLGQLAFEQYSLNESADYMANNGIVFHAILLGNAPPSEEIRYLCNETGGSAVRLYQSEGIGPLLKKLVSKPSGSYFLRFTSSLPADFGRALLPVEAEVYLLERSGRDAAGYFSPVE